MSAEQTLNASIENLEFELAQAIQKLLYPQKKCLGDDHRAWGAG